MRRRIWHGWTVTSSVGVTLKQDSRSVAGRAFFVTRREAREWRRELQPHLRGIRLHVVRASVSMSWEPHS